MQDFAAYGVVDQADKHRLYRAIKSARMENLVGSGATDGAGELGGGGASSDLLDLDAHDGDLLEVCQPDGPDGTRTGMVWPLPCTHASAAHTCT